MKNLIKEAYNYAKLTNNEKLSKDIDVLVKEERLFILENYNSGNYKKRLSEILENHNILNEEGEIIKTQMYVKDKDSINAFLKNCGKTSRSLYESAIKIIDHYSYEFADKKIIFSKDIKKINEALTYLNVRNQNKKSKQKRINESLDNLSNIELEVGNYEYYSMDDFISIFDSKFWKEHQSELSDMEMLFNNNCVITLNIYEDPNTLSGYNCSISWDCEVFLPQHEIENINSIIEKYIKEDIAYSKANESLEDLSNINLSEGQFEYTNYEDFISMFDDNWLANHQTDFDDLSLWFNNGGTVVINVFHDENSVTGFDCSLSWSNGDSQIMNHNRINSLVKKYITNDIANSVNENSDDFDMIDYNLGSGNLQIGEYQIIESNKKEFLPFDIITIISSTPEITVVQFENGDKVEYLTSDLTSTLAYFYKDYDTVFECMEWDLSLPDTGITEDDIKTIIANKEISYESVLEILINLKDNNLCVPSNNGCIHWKDDKFIEETVDEFGNSHEEEICERCVISYIVLFLAKEKESDHPIPFHSDIEGKYDIQKTYNAILTSNLLEGDLLSDFVEEWNRFVLPYSETNDANADQIIEGLAMKYEVYDLLILNDGITSVENSIDSAFYGKEEIVDFLSSHFDGIPKEEIEEKMTDENIIKFNKQNTEFYTAEENLENDDDTAEKYVNFLLDFMKECGIYVGIYR